MKELKAILTKTSALYYKEHAEKCLADLKKIYRDKQYFSFTLAIGSYQYHFRIFLDSCRQDSYYLKLPSLYVSLQKVNKEFTTSKEEQAKRFLEILKNEDANIHKYLLQACQEPKKSKLSTGTIKLSMKCNAGCPFCIERDVPKTSKSNDPPWATLAQMIDRAKEKFTQIVFSGGEPTISPYLEKAIAYAQEKKFRSIGIATNGIRLADKEYLKKLLVAGLNMINFSLHTVNAESSALNYGRGIWSQQHQALENIKACRSQLRRLTFQATISSLNQDCLAPLLKAFAEYDPTQILMTYCYSHDHLADLESTSIVEDIEKAAKGPLKKNNVIFSIFPFCKVSRDFWGKLQNYVPPGDSPDKPGDWGTTQLNFMNADHAKACDPCICKGGCSFPSRAYVEKFGTAIEPVKDLGGIKILGC